MKKAKLKDGQVFSVRLKDGSFALAQFTTGSHVAFFKAFSDTDEWEDDSAETSELLFICVGIMQFFEYSIVNVLENVRPRVFASLPRFWIEQFHGGRKVVVSPGTKDERTIALLNQRPGGRIVEQLIGRGIQKRTVVKSSIDLDDDATIDGHETTSFGYIQA